MRRCLFFVIQAPDNPAYFLTARHTWSRRILRARRFRSELFADATNRKLLDGRGGTMPVIAPRELLRAEAA